MRPRRGKRKQSCLHFTQGLAGWQARRVMEVVHTGRALLHRLPQQRLSDLTARSGTGSPHAARRASGRMLAAATYLQAPWCSRGGGRRMRDLIVSLGDAKHARAGQGGKRRWGIFWGREGGDMVSHEACGRKMVGVRIEHLMRTGGGRRGGEHRQHWQTWLAWRAGPQTRPFEDARSWSTW